jgi:ATP-dependent DNA helicase RecQ
MENKCFQILREQFHFADFREGQEEIIEALLLKRDVVAVMPTGSGKSLCYQLPALLLEGVTLVISPLIALMKDQVDGLARNHIPATFINSTLTPSEQQQRMWQVRQGKFRLVYVAPERFRSPAFMEGIQTSAVSLLAVDEAHCVSEWGHDFRPDYLRLKSVIAKLNHPPVAALTATATPEVRRDIIEQLGLNQPLTFVTGFDRPNLHFQVFQVENDRDKMEAVLAFVKQESQCGIIYASTRKHVDEVTLGLQTRGYKVGSYHAGMEMAERKSVQDQFMQGNLPVVVATNAFGMGIDKADLRFIVHYDVPGSLEAYYQEVGRAGRDCKPSTCLLLFNYADVFTQEFFIEGNYPARALVEEVYHELCSFGTDELEITLKALAQRCRQGKSSEMSVSSCLKILDKAGAIERGTEGEHLARLTLLIEPEMVSQQLEHKSILQKEVLSYCLDFLGALKGRTVAFDLQSMSEGLNLSLEQLRRVLAGLHHSGTIEYRAPFRGRGLKVLERLPASKLSINFGDIERRAQFERQKLRKMVDYAYTQKCLRRFILEYFGEQFKQSDCHNCSSCLAKEETTPARTLSEEETLIVKKVLSCVARMKGQYGRMRVAQVLTGSQVKALEGLRLNRLSTYGLLREFTQPEVLSILDALIESAFLEIEGTEYLLVKLTEKGREAMLGKHPVCMALPLIMHQNSPGDDREGLVVQRPADRLDLAYHEELFEALREMRRKIAFAANLPPYVIFHDETLKAISRQLPRDPAELRAVRGCGERKTQAYGTQTLKVVETFLQNHPEAQPIVAEDRAHSKQSAAVGALSPTFELTWKLWEQGKNVAEIAAERRLTPSTIFDHLGRLLREGRTIDLERQLSKDRISMIENALARVGADRLTQVKILLPEDFSYDEIRLVMEQQGQRRRVQAGES